MTKQPTSQTSLVTMPEGEEHRYHIGLCALAKCGGLYEMDSIESCSWPLGSGPISKCGPAEGGMALLDKICHCGSRLWAFKASYT